ncbi:hypothetical protein NY035_01835 [Corynebacterium diphtheriae bv. mitis]|uniref:glutaredoxin domain-containing protein n=1 Tax=Corynebacterium diphtheriae TaxID=1717 RepID=UPI0013CBFD04|nr:glutaredoxin domain-containing protein [Corynebacterium diphtheriae]MBG9359021.1 hypothetical protein [Corynebacterium diphtheriae bv. mitis]MBG9361135.1 hypothetical protein [Corynebacterium diphtheriae bv. mitis]MBG9363300.1 hypothetical protein [Corynebacterium diphtheriae bv. mitis]MBG9365442.1 hypothetical protein [Corynebacterium diphtheriae bv. mitis]UWE84718.1 hypothetical protein NY053_05040 [Corynebacterium diphtheriae bv. mitis]
MTNPVAVVYTRPGCQKCRQTERQLAKLGITVTTELIDNYPHKIDHMQRIGGTELPLVELTVGKQTMEWTGLHDANFAAVKELLR